MYGLLVAIHIVFCIFLIIVILLQAGKGGGMGAAFGGGTSQTVFGPRGAGSFIGKVTGTVACLFMITSLVLAYLSSSGSTGVADKASALNEQRSAQTEEVDLQTGPTDTSTEEISTEPDTAGNSSTDDSIPIAADTAPGNDTGNQTPSEGGEKQPSGLDTKSAVDNTADNEL